MSVAKPSPPSRNWALITGVSPGGIGEALTLALLRRDISVIATGLELEHLDHLSSSDCTAQLAKLQLDVTATSSITSAVTGTTELLAKHGGKLSYLFNNAGCGYFNPITDISLLAMKANFDVNVFGLIAVTQAFFPLLHEAKGTIVNQGSIASLSPGRQPYIGVYSATKAALASLNDTMRVEMAPFGVKVVQLVTGDVATEFWNHHEVAFAGAKLPPGSLYAPIRDDVEKIMRGETRPAGAHDRHVWAGKVVDDLLRNTEHPPRFIRRGFLAVVIYIASLLLPVWMADWAFAQACKLIELRELLHGQAADVGKKDRID